MSMFYIHRYTCISPQQTFPVPELEELHRPVNNKLYACEPSYDSLPKGVLRRMSKPVRMGVGAAVPILKEYPAPDGIIIGTANAGMEDCLNFLQQIVQYDEGLLTPGNFVQSTPNALAAQVSMLSHNKGYNITHVHLGLAFENAMIDAGMLISEKPGNTYLLGAVDDISASNYNINSLEGWYKESAITGDDLYTADSPGSIAGEAAAMFLVDGDPALAVAMMVGVETVHSADVVTVKEQLINFLSMHLPGQKVDLLVSGENGDCRLDKYYESCEGIIDQDAGILRFKHMSGEYPTASAMAVWLGCYFLENKAVPPHMVKRPLKKEGVRNMLIYNTYKGAQHSFILLSAL